MVSDPTAYGTLATTSHPNPKPFAFARVIFVPFSVTTLPTTSPTVYTTGKISLQRPLGPGTPTLSRTATFPFSSMVMAVMLLGIR